MTPESQAIIDAARARQSQAGDAGGQSAPQNASTMTTEELIELGRQRRRGEGHQGLFSHLGDNVMGIARGARDLVMGQQDPEFADTPVFDRSAIPDQARAGIERGRAVTFDDESYADIVRNQLGNRFIGMERDANNYPLVRYIGTDGEERLEYINRPGLDFDDVDRGIASSVPFMLGAGAANLGLRGLGAAGTKARMLFQGGAAAGTSVAADQAAQSLGSEQGTDIPRALIAGAAGSVFEGLSGPIARGWMQIFRENPVTPDGRLTGEAAEAARRAGLNPSEMEERLARAFARDQARARIPDEVAAKFRPGEFGIETTRGQRTKLSDQLGLEEEMRRGLLGRDAQSVMVDFDRRQKQAIEGAVYDRIGNQIAPSAAARDPRGLGDNIRTGARAARDNVDQQAARMWGEAGEMAPQQGAFQSLPGILRNNIDEANVRIDPRLTPAADSMMRELDRYAAGRIPKSQYALLPEEVRRLDVDQMRRRLLAAYNSAQPGSPDANAARAIYNGFNDWIDEAAARHMLSGSPDSAAALRAARGFTRETKELFQPRQGGKMTPAARRLANVIDKSDSGEGVVRALFGSGGPTSAPPEGSVQAVRHMRDILTRHGQDQVWDDVRMAYWIRLAQDSQGRVLSAGRLRNNIDAAMRNQDSLMKELYTGPELDMMQRLARALDDVVYTPPNPSGTSYEARRMAQPNRLAVAAKGGLRAQASRESLAKGNILASRIYAAIGRLIPNAASRENIGGRVAQRAIDQGVLERRPGAMFIAPLASRAAAQDFEMDQAP